MLEMRRNGPAASVIWTKSDARAGHARSARFVSGVERRPRAPCWHWNQGSKADSYCSKTLALLLKRPNFQSTANYSARSAHENAASSSWLRAKVRIRGTAPMRAAWLALE